MMGDRVRVDERPIDLNRRQRVANKRDVDSCGRAFVERTDNIETT